ncbi:pyroglutamyl-peptidase I [Bacillus carboniphilus]|uniref:Pyrrolidone-carboxylate peptidase n=1 Tax=Bacillus carboniphilus TaxID=86663 RepID=A0ABN0VXD8_9BACI
MKTLLLTGFEPFLGMPINPTERIAKSLDGETIGAYKIKSVLLPVDFEKSPVELMKAFHDVKPDAVISLGLAAGRDAVTPERIAINIRDGAPDNNGVALEDSPIDDSGQDGYFSTLPVRKMVNLLKENGYPANVSNSAGTYLCNNVMYTMLHHLKTEGLNMQAGFIHIPASHDLVVEGKKRMPSWSQRDLESAIRLAIECLDAE